MLADPTSGTIFYKSWTYIERGEPIEHHSPIFALPPFINRPPPAINGNTSITSKYFQTRPKPAQISIKKMATSTFKFSNTIIKQSLSKITEKCPNATPFDYLTALFWLQIIKNKTLIEHSPTQSLSLCIDTRNHLGVPTPSKFFGNALSFSQLSLENAVLMDNNGLMEAVESVHRHVNAINKEEVIRMMDWLDNSPLDSVQMYGPELTCVSLEHLMSPKDDLVYEAKFRNNERPVHVSYHVGKAEGEGLIIVAPSPEAGMGRMVTVTLPEEEMAKLCEDPVIMEMEPTMILTKKI